MSKKLAKNAILILIITILSKITGFLRDVVLAAYFGATYKTDAFVMAQTVTGFFLSVILAGLGTTFIPVMSDYLAHKPKEETNKFLNVVYTVCLVLTAAICTAAFIFAGPVVRVFAPRFSPEVFSLAVQLTRIILPSAVLGVLVTLNSAVLQNHGSFLIPASTGFPMNISMIAVMILGASILDIQGLAAAVVAGTLLQFIMQYPFAKKLGYIFRFEFDLNEEGLKRIGILVVPTIIGSGIQQINTMVDRMLSSGLESGSVAALNFANRLNLFIIGLLSAVVGSVYYTSMSKYFAESRIEEYKKLLRNTVNILTIIVLPASFGFFVLRLPIVKFVFERGVFDSKASDMTAIALFFYTIGLLGFSLREVLARAFYALKDTKTSMINGAVAVVINIIISVSLVPYLGIGGIALGTSVSGIVGTILLFFALRKKIGGFKCGQIILVFLKSSAAGAVMAAAVKYLYSILYDKTASNTFSLFSSILTGCLIYFIILLFMKIEEIDMMREQAIKYIKNIFLKNKENKECINNKL